MRRRSSTARMWLIPLALGPAMIPACTAPIFLATAGLSAVREGTSAYANGELAAVELATIGEVREAVLSALERLEFEVRTDRVRDASVYIVAADRISEVKISLSERTDVVTKVRIRVGTFGDQALSRFLLRQIDEELAVVQGRGGAAPGRADQPSSP